MSSMNIPQPKTNKGNVKLRLGWRINQNGWSLSRDRKRGGVRYRRGKWTYPKENCGPLTVFDTLIHAVESLDSLSYSFDIEFLPCAYDPDPYYAVFEEDGPSWLLDELPQGTVLASAVYIFKKQDQWQPMPVCDPEYHDEDNNED